MLLACSHAQPVRASQATGESIVVRVEWEGAPLPGVIVTLSLTRPGFMSRVEATDVNGIATFTAIPKGTYDLRFDMAGFFAQTLHDVPVGDAERKLPKEIRVIPVLGPTYH